MAAISVIILNWNTYSLVESCIRSIQETSDTSQLEIIVVDNGSSDGSPDQIEAAFPDARVARLSNNLGFAAGNNHGVSLSQAPLVLLLNSDTQVKTGAIDSLQAVIDTHPKAGLVGARLLNLDGTFQASYTPFPTLWQEFLILTGIGRLIFGGWFPSHGPEMREGAKRVDYVEGACMLARRDAYLQAGGLNEEYFMYAEDVELCISLKKLGWETWYQPAAEIIHLAGGSSQNRKPEREADLYTSRVKHFRRHRGRFQAGLLSLMISAFTFVKWLGHGLVRFVSRGKRGRLVVSPAALYQSLMKSH